MEIGINIVDVVKYISFTMVCSVLVEIKVMHLLTIKDGIEFIITVAAYSSDFSFYLPTLQEMINSFAFIPTVTTPTKVITGLLLGVTSFTQNYYPYMLFVTVVLFPLVG